ncbi:MAG: cell division protein ZapA [Pontixanthobacter sp.]
MSEVKLSVGGRDYTVACADGEEAHVCYLGEQIDAKLQQLGAGRSSSESQNLLFGALFLADELHEARNTAATATATLSEHANDLQNAKHEANLAVGQREELKSTISRLESELEGLQSAQQRHSAEVDDLRDEVQRRRQEAEVFETERDRMTAQLAELTREKTSMTAQLENKDVLLERANEHIQQKNAALQDAKDAQANNLSAQAAAALTSSDSDLAPALERFADLLENCATKLESRAANP